MNIDIDRTQDSLCRLMADERLVQAGAWIAGYLHFHPNQAIALPADVRGAPDPTTDVPYPDWPFGTQEESQAALRQFAAAGLLSEQGTGEWHPTDRGDAFFPILPLFHVRNGEQIERRFPQLREAVAGQRVLDAGCGLAPYSVWLDELGAAEVIGVDCFQKHLDLAARVVSSLRATHVRLLFGFLENLPLPDACVDFVFCRGVVSLAHSAAPCPNSPASCRPAGNAS